MEGYGSRVLVVEPNLRMGRLAARALGGGAGPTVVRSAREASDLLRDRSFLTAGVVVERTLPDGDGFTLVEHLREGDPGLPAAVWSCAFSDEEIRRANRLGIEILAKPSVAAFQSISERWKRRRSSEIGDQEREAEILAAHWRLSDRQTDVVKAALVDERRYAIADELGIQESTVKWHAARIAEKSGLDLHEVVALVRLRTRRVRS